MSIILFLFLLWFLAHDGAILTVLLVEQNLELVAYLSLEALLDARDGLLVGELAVHEAAAT